MPAVKHTLRLRSSMLPAIGNSMLYMSSNDFDSRYFDLSTLGGRVGHALRESGLQVEAAASRLGINRQAIYQWIDGRTKNIKNEYLFGFADITGFSARWIATGEGSQRPPRYEDRRVQHALRVMESLPDYAIDGAVKELDSIAELIEKASERPEDKKAS